MPTVAAIRFYFLCCRPLSCVLIEWVCVWTDGDGHARMEWLQDSDLNLKGILARYHEGYYKTAHEMRLHVIRLWHNWSLFFSLTFVAFF